MTKKNTEPELNDEKNELEKCEKEKEEYLNGWKREKADFINYKKEEGARLKEIASYSARELVLKILPIIDDFDLAAKEIPEEKKEDTFIKGLLQIKILFQDFLKKENVEEINCLGQDFDPYIHEAVGMVEADEKSGIIVEEIQKGYKVNGRLIRPAKVKVAK